MSWAAGPGNRGKVRANIQQRPFANFYGCTFILYELSSPFLNFHWFFDKLGMTGSLGQLINGIMLIVTFFCCRLVWGTYQSLQIYQDMWKALHHDPATSKIHYEALQATDRASHQAATGLSAAPIHHGIMRFAGDEYIPLWITVMYVISNLILNSLNFYWFSKMIDALRKRFEPVEKTKEPPVVTRNTGADGKVKIDIDETEVRRRHVTEVPPPT